MSYKIVKTVILSFLGVAGTVSASNMNLSLQEVILKNADALKRDVGFTSSYNEGQGGTYHEIPAPYCLNGKVYDNKEEYDEALEKYLRCLGFDQSSILSSCPEREENDQSELKELSDTLYDKTNEEYRERLGRIRNGQDVEYEEYVIEGSFNDINGKLQPSKAVTVRRENNATILNFCAAEKILDFNDPEIRRSMGLD